uniref:Uncharacterized protein n=1 Tax=Magallana gigas TaxID=29159 RepID=A0A8W8I0B2_MAGGI
MSCQLNVFADFHNITSVRNFLFPELRSEPPVSNEVSENDGWDEDWGSWGEEGGEDPDIPDGREPDDKHQWLQECVISLSPTNDIVAVAHSDRCVLLSRMLI